MKDMYRSPNVGSLSKEKKQSMIPFGSQENARFSSASSGNHPKSNAILEADEFEEDG